MEVQKAKDVADKLRGLGQRARDLGGCTVVVGYQTAYALFQHEGTGIFGPTGKPIVPVEKKALSWVGKDGVRRFAKSVKGVRPRKFLEGPARRLSKDGTLGRIVAEYVKEHGVEALHDAVYVAGLQVQRASQDECPVDTGVMRNSSFCEKE